MTRRTIAARLRQPLFNTMKNITLVLFLFLACNKTTVKEFNLTKEVNFSLIDSTSGETIKDMDLAVCHDHTELPICDIFRDYKITSEANGTISFKPTDIKVYTTEKKNKISYYLYFRKAGYRFLKLRLTDSMDGKKILISKLKNR